MANKSTERRYAAIKAHSDKWRPEHNGYRLIDNADPEQIIAEIEAMRSLGRTERWQNSITGWVNMIHEYPESLEWAVLQGAIYAAYAAE